MRNNKNSDFGIESVKDGNVSMFKSIEESEQSNKMEAQLREENMLLRQEILQLKKALFMNNMNQDQLNLEKTDININQLLSPQALSSTYFKMLLSNQGTSPESERMIPMSEVPKPYCKVPTRPLNSAAKQTSEETVNNTSSVSIEFPLNIALMSKNIQEYQPKILTKAFPKNDLVVLQDGIKEHVSEENCVQSYEANDQQIQRSIEQPGSVSYDQKCSLRMKASINDQFYMFDPSLEMKSIRDQLSKYSDDKHQQEELDRLEQLVREDNLHINTTLLNDNKEDFESMKRKSSVFEIKRHYENEIEALKKDLELIRKEESKIKQKLGNEGATTSIQSSRDKQTLQTLKQEFTFKNDALRRLQKLDSKQDVSFRKQTNESNHSMVQTEDVSSQNKSNVEKMTALSNLSRDQMKQQYKNQKRQSQTTAHSRINSSEKIKQAIKKGQDIDQKTCDMSREPPSFSNSVINTGQNSPKSKINVQKTSVFAALSPNQNEPCQDASGFSQVDSSHFESFIKRSNLHKHDESVDKTSNVNSEFIEEIFMDQDKQNRFICLDTIKNLHQLEGFNQPLTVTSNKDCISPNGSYHESSFCYHINVRSEQSSIAVVQAQDRVRQDQEKEVKEQQTQNKNSINDMLGRRLSGCVLYQPKPSAPAEPESPKAKLTSQQKDLSPSFGGRKVHGVGSAFSQVLKKAQNTQRQTGYMSKQPSQVNIGIKTQTRSNISINQSKSCTNSRPPSQTRSQKSCSTNAKKRLDKIMRSVISAHKKKVSMDYKSGNDMTSAEKSKVYDTVSSKTSKTQNNSQQRNAVSSMERRYTADLKSCKVQEVHKLRDAINGNNNQSPLMNATYSGILNQSKSQLSFSKHNISTTFHQLPEEPSYIKTPLEVTKIFQDKIDYLKNIEQTTSMLDPEFLYDLKNKSHSKKRTKMLQKKENMQRMKLNEKMARIQEIQKCKEEKRQSIIESRQNRSPSKNLHGIGSSIVNFVSIGQELSSERFNSTTNNVESNYQSRGQLSNRVDEKQVLLQTLFTKQSQSNQSTRVFTNLKSYNPSYCTSRLTSNRATENNTPLASARRNNDQSIEKSLSRERYQTPLGTRVKQIQILDEGNNQSLIHNKSASLIHGVNHHTDRQPLTTKGNYYSTSNLFKKTPQVPDGLNTSPLNSRFDKISFIDRNSTKNTSSFSTKMKDRIKTTILNINKTPVTKSTKPNAYQKNSQSKKSMFENNKHTSARMNNSFVGGKYTTDILRQYCSEIQGKVNQQSMTQRNSMTSNEVKQSVVKSQANLQNKYIRGQNKGVMDKIGCRLEPIVEDFAQ